jgi:hypothetical protein
VTSSSGPADVPGYQRWPHRLPHALATGLLRRDASLVSSVGGFRWPRIFRVIGEILPTPGGWILLSVVADNH